MRGSHTKSASKLFTDWLAKKSRAWQPSYSNLQSPEKDTGVNALWDAPRVLCVYCGRRLRRDRPQTHHIEHFRPQSTYPELSTRFANLFLSCGRETAAEVSHNLGGAATATGSTRKSTLSPTIPVVRTAFGSG